MEAARLRSRRHGDDVEPGRERKRSLFFRLSSVELGLIVFGIVLGSTLLGVVAGRQAEEPTQEALREPFRRTPGRAARSRRVSYSPSASRWPSGRYDSRRAAVVDDANAIGTTYLRAQTLREPMRTRSLEDLVRYTDTSILLSESVPGSAASRAEIAKA